MSTNYNLKKDNSYFKSALPQLLQTNKGMFALIHNCEIQGFYSSREEALNATKGKYVPGEFLVKEVVEDDGFPKAISYKFAFV